MWLCECKHERVIANARDLSHAIWTLLLRGSEYDLSSPFGGNIERAREHLPRYTILRKVCGGNVCGRGGQVALRLAEYIHPCAGRLSLYIYSICDFPAKHATHNTKTTSKTHIKHS